MTLLCRRVVNEDEEMDDDDNNNNNRLRFSYLSSVRVFLSFFFSLFCVCVCLFVCMVAGPFGNQNKNRHSRHLDENPVMIFFSGVETT